MIEIILLSIIFSCLIIKSILAIFIFKNKMIALANKQKLRGGTRL